MSFWSDAWSWISGSSITANLAKTALLGYSVKLINDNINEGTKATVPATIDQGVRLQLTPNTENKIPVLYGSAFFAGDITDANLSADYKTMTYCLTLAETTGTKLSGGSSSYTFNNVYLNNNRVVFKSDGVTVDYTLDRAGNQDISYRDLVKIYFYANGSGIQPSGRSGVTPASYTIMPGWTQATHPMTGLIYAIIKVKYNRDKGVTGLPECVFQVTNSMSLPGDVLYDYMTNSRYGARIADSEILSSSLAALNSFCSTGFSYTNAQGQTVNSPITINGIINTESSVLDNMEEIVKAACSWLSYDIYLGKWRVIINRAGSSIASLNDSNLIGEISISGTSLTQLNNIADVRYLNNSIQDKPDFVKITLPENTLYANEPRTSMQIDLPYTNKQAVALKIGAQLLKQARVDKIIKFTTDYSYINLTAGDLIDITNSVYGFVNKVFRIITVEEIEGNNGEIQVEFTALEYSADVYQFAITEFQVETNDGIIQIGSIGKQGAPQISTIEMDSRPRIYISCLSPSGVVEGIEFWLTRDVSAPNDIDRTYELIGTRRPVNGELYPEDTEVILEYDRLSADDFYIKTRGFNSQVFGPFSDPSGLIMYRPTQVTQALNPDTAMLDNLGNLALAFTILDLLKGVDGLFSGDSTNSSMFKKIFNIFEDVTGFDLIADYGGTTDTPTYDLTVSATSVNEGDSFVVNLATTNLVDGKNVPYTITGVSSADINGASLAGNFVINKNKATLVFKVSADLVNDSETFVLTLNGITPTESISVQFINVAPTTSYQLESNFTTVTEGQQFKITLNTQNVANGTVIPYTITGVSSTDINGASLTGNFTVNNNTASATFTTKSDGLSEGSENFVLTLNGISPNTSVSVAIYDQTAPVTNNLLVIDTKLPPDRATHIDPITGAESDNASITGSYFIKFSGWTTPEGGTVKAFRGPLVQGTGGISLYQSDGVLVESVTADQLIINQNVVEIPFSKRDVGTDYYILMDAGVVQYCSASSSPIVSPTVWNFNTPTVEPPLPNPYASPTVTNPNPNADPLIAIGYKPSGSCPSNLILTFSEPVNVGYSGNVYVRSVETNQVKVTISAVTGVAIGNTIDYGPLPDSVMDGKEYYITADAGVATATCYLLGSQAITVTDNFKFKIIKLVATEYKLKRLDEVVTSTVGTPNIYLDIRPDTNIRVKFSTPIEYGANGNFTLYKNDGTIHQSFDILTNFQDNKTSEIIWLENNDTVVLNPTKDLRVAETYYLNATPGVVKNSCPQFLPGIDDSTSIRFKIAGSKPFAVRNDSIWPMKLGIQFNTEIGYAPFYKIGSSAARVKIINSNNTVIKAFTHADFGLVAGQTYSYYDTMSVDITNIGLVAGVTHYVTIDADWVISVDNASNEPIAKGTEGWSIYGTRYSAVRSYLNPSLLEIEFYDSNDTTQNQYWKTGASTTRIKIVNSNGNVIKSFTHADFGLETGNWYGSGSITSVDITNIGLVAGVTYYVTIDAGWVVSNYGFPNFPIAKGTSGWSVTKP